MKIREKKRLKNNLQFNKFIFLASKYRKRYRYYEEMLQIRQQILHIERRDFLFETIDLKSYKLIFDEPRSRMRMQIFPQVTTLLYTIIRHPGDRDKVAISRRIMSIYSLHADTSSVLPGIVPMIKPRTPLFR